MTPAAAIASMNTPVSCRSVMPGASADSAACSERSAMRTEARIASTSSVVFTRRTRRSIGSPSTSSADGKALGRRFEEDSDMLSVATTRAVAAPSILRSALTKLAPLKEIPYRFS